MFVSVGLVLSGILAVLCEVSEGGAEELASTPHESVSIPGPGMPAAGLSSSDIPETMTFEAYVSLFGKAYATAAEKNTRRAVFDANVAFIRHHNMAAAAAGGFRCGVNQHSDLNSEEFRERVLDRGGYLAGRRKRVVGDAPEIARSPLDLVPASVDWTAKGAVTPVKNQGSCGACWSFAAAASLEGSYQIATGALRNISEQQLIDCSSPFGNEGC